MSRLTNEIRKQMARKLVQYRYAGEAKELVRLNRELADRAHANIYTPEILKAIEILGKTFSRMSEKRRSFTVIANGYRVEMGGSLCSDWVRFDMPVHDGYTVLEYYNSKPAITDIALATEIQDYATRCKNFEDVCRTAYHEAIAVLNTMTTGKKLAEAWPEAIPVIGDLIPEDARTLPVVQVSAINAKFKLPPEKAVS